MTKGHRKILKTLDIRQEQLVKQALDKMLQVSGYNVRQIREPRPQPRIEAVRNVAYLVLFRSFELRKDLVHKIVFADKQRSLFISIKETHYHISMDSSLRGLYLDMVDAAEPFTDAFDNILTRA